MGGSPGGSVVEPASGWGEETSALWELVFPLMIMTLPKTTFERGRDEARSGRVTTADMSGKKRTVR